MYQNLLNENNVQQNVINKTTRGRRSLVKTKLTKMSSIRITYIKNLLIKYFAP